MNTEKTIQAARNPQLTVIKLNAKYKLPNWSLVTQRG